MTTMFKEKRRHPRHNMTVCAWLKFRDEENPRCTRSCDLSREGARFITLRKVSLGEPVLIHLELRNNQPLECKAIVRWSRKLNDGMYEFGVRFLDLHDEEYDLLDSILSEHEVENLLAV